MLIMKIVILKCSEWNVSTQMLSVMEILIWTYLYWNMKYSNDQGFECDTQIMRRMQAIDCLELQRRGVSNWIINT